MQGIFPVGWWKEALRDVPKRTGEVSLCAEALLGQGENDGVSTVAHIVCQMRAAQAEETTPTLGEWIGEEEEQDIVVAASGSGSGCATGAELAGEEGDHEGDHQQVAN